MNIKRILNFEGTPQAKNAYNASLIFFAASILSLPVYAVIAYQAQVWQGWFLVVLTIWLTFAGSGGMALSKRGKPTQAMILMIVSIVLGGWVGSSLIAGLGTLMSILIALVSVVFAAQALPRHWLNRTLILGSVAGLLAAFIGLISKSLQAEIPALQGAAVPILAIAVFIGFGFIIVRQFAQYPFSTKLLILLLVIVLASVNVVTVTVNQVVGSLNLQSEVVEAVQRATTYGSLATILISGLFSLFAAQFLTRPINSLTEVASRIAAGDLHARAVVQTEDEIGSLAQTFNSMVTQLETSVNTLETRVAERTHNLELAAKVGRTISQVQALDVMLSEAVELIRNQFDLNYVQVYLANPSQTELILQAGTGHVGEQLLLLSHRLPLNNRSLNGRAAAEKHPIVILDTTTSASFKPNPLLPNIRSEMAVPLLVGDRVVGVLDMQSERPGSLTEETLSAFEALAGQLSIAIQNASLLAETEHARVEVEKQAARLSRVNWAEYLDGIYKPEKLAFIFAQGKVTPMNEEKIKDTSLSAPITISGEIMGDLGVEVEMEGQAPVARAGELVHAVARQVAQQIESLRLLESAERYRLEAEQASRRLTRENWQEYKQANTDKNLSYLYDQKEVRAYNHEDNEQPQSSDLNLSLKIRDEEIGQVVVQGFDTNNPDNLDLANAVVERLSQHIESLRLLEKTEESRSEIQISQERLSEALGIAKLANWEYDVEKDLFQFNDNFYAVLHTTVQEVGGYQLASADYASRFVHPDDVPIVGVEIGKALSSTERHFSSSVEHRVIFADGETGYLSVSIQVERDEEGKITRYYGANQDITERKRAEEELRTREAQLSMVLKQTEKLFEASRRLTQVADLQELVKTTVEIFDISVINGAELDLFSYDSRGDLESLTVIANWWNGAGTAPGAVGSRFSKEMFSAVKLFLTSTPVFISDALDSERVDAGMMRIVKAFNIRAVTFLPLFIGANQIGVLVMHAEQTHDFTEDETRLFSGLAPQIATVLENRNQYQRAQQQAERESTLNTISQKIQSATTVEAVLQIAARELGHALGAPMTIAQLSMKDKK